MQSETARQNEHKLQQEARLSEIQMDIANIKYAINHNFNYLTELINLIGEALRDEEILDLPELKGFDLDE